MTRFPRNSATNFLVGVTESDEDPNEEYQTHPVLAIVKLASDLIDEADLDDPPFDPRILASYRHVREIRRKPMLSAARLLPEGGALVIEVNEGHSLGKQNFSIDHEVTHTLFPTYTGQFVDDVSTGQFSERNEEEYLCDVGASTLLLDPRWLRPRALEAGPSLQAIFALADLFKGSLQATARKIVELDLWPCAVVFWEEGYRKADRVPKNQKLLMGFEGFGGPQPKLRVACPYTSASFVAQAGFIPTNKSVDARSLVARCCKTDDVTYGIETFDFGHRLIRLYCENVYAPYKSNAVVCRRVVSLLSPVDQKQNAPSKMPTEAQLEIF